MKIRHLIITAAMVCASVSYAVSQNIYFGEAGASGGVGFVLGDRNGMLFRCVKPLGGAFIKYKFNGHWELKFQVDGGMLGINPRDGMQESTWFGDAQVLGEFNFFNFGVHKWEPFRTWVSPCLTAGVGMVIFPDHVTMTVPMGIGVKFKLSDHVNMGAYWMVTKTFSDALDYVDDPLGLNRGLWNNRDWYSTAQAYISFNFGKICAPCRNRERMNYEQSKHGKRY